MSNAYEEASKIGLEGCKVVRDFFEARGCSVVDTGVGRLSKEIQLIYGDFFIESPKTKDFKAVEVKTEVKFTGNLFLESWSNYATKNKGWFFKMKSDILIYIFTDKKLIYFIDYPKLKTFIEETAFLYREVKQKKYNQLNDSRGLLFPVYKLEESKSLIHKMTY